MQPSKREQAFLAVAATIGWLALGLQFYLLLLNRITSVPEAITRFFSFYTILTNILVSLCFTILLLKPNDTLGKFFSKSKTSTAIAVYITIVGLVYNTILRFTWSPEGLQRVVDEVLHVVVPLLFLLYWFLFATKTGLLWKNVFSWLLYPLVYVTCVLFRGALAGFYPYPFLDANVLGYRKVFINCAELLCVFLAMSLFLVAIAKVINRNSRIN